MERETFASKHGSPQLHLQIPAGILVILAVDHLDRLVIFRVDDKRDITSQELCCESRLHKMMMGRHDAAGPGCLNYR